MEQDLLGHLLVPEPSPTCVCTQIVPAWVLTASLASGRGWEELAVLCPTHTLPQQVWGCKLWGQGAGDTLGCPVVQPGAFPQAAGESVGWEQSVGVPAHSQLHPAVPRVPAVVPAAPPRLWRS